MAISRMSIEITTPAASRASCASSPAIATATTATLGRSLAIYRRTGIGVCTGSRSSLGLLRLGRLLFLVLGLRVVCRCINKASQYLITRPKQRVYTQSSAWKGFWRLPAMLCFFEMEMEEGFEGQHGWLSLVSTALAVC